MDIVSLFVILSIIGLIAWAVMKLVPMPTEIKNVILVAAVVICVFIVIKSLFGPIAPLPSLK